MITSVSPGQSHKNALGGTVREQRPHLGGEVVTTIAEQDALAIAQQVGDPRDEELPRDAEAGPGQHILEPVCSRRRGALAGPRGGPEVFPHERLDLIVRDSGHPRTRRLA